MNILLIMADQLAARRLGCYGHPVVRTPNVDALAAGGIVFDNMYCNSPLCVPSRASMVTGRLPGHIDSFDNGSVLHADRPTLMHRLRAGGYRTILAGKMHFVGPDQLHGAQERLTCDIYPAGIDWTANWQHDLHSGGRSVRKLDRSGPVDSPTIEMQYDQLVLDQSLKRLDELAAAGDDKPWFLWTSFTHPHDPFTITREFWDIYANAPIDPPDTPTDNPPHPFNAWINQCHSLDRIQPDEEAMIRSRRGYYGAVSYVDRNVGLLLDRLNSLGLADNTAVVFTSDHGEMLGEHGMWFKRTFFEDATRVPFIVRLPGGPGGRRVGSVASLVDLLPTLAALAGVDAGGPLDGASFAPLIRGASMNWKDEAICEYLGEGTQQPMRFVRRGRHKYVAVNAGEPLLFDLETDPHERNNLAGQTATAEVESHLAGRLLDEGDLAKLRQRIIQDQQVRLGILAAVGDATTKLWDYPPGHFLGGQ